MLGITDLTTFIIGTIAVVLLPGPNSMYVLTTAAQKGVRRGYMAACGVFVGDSILMLLAVLGAATVFKTAPQVFLTLKLAGGAYLAFLGFKMLVGAYQIWKNRAAILSQPTGAKQHNGCARRTCGACRGFGALTVCQSFAD